LNSGTVPGHQGASFGRVTGSDSLLITISTRGVSGSGKAVSHYVKRVNSSVGKIDYVGKTRKSCSPPDNRELCATHLTFEIERNLMRVLPASRFHKRGSRAHLPSRSQWLFNGGIFSLHDLATVLGMASGRGIDATRECSPAVWFGGRLPPG